MSEWFEQQRAIIGMVRAARLAGSNAEWPAWMNVETDDNKMMPVVTTPDDFLILVAGGRTPNTDGIGLELAAVETTDRGFVKVNERLQTTAANTWAVGDCAAALSKAMRR